jgi:hypothetical protein
VVLDRRVEDRVADLLGALDLLPLEVLEPEPPREGGRQHHVDVTVDRRGHGEAAVLAVVGGEVGAAAAQWDAQRRPRYYGLVHRAMIEHRRGPRRTAPPAPRRYEVGVGCPSSS